jgi:DNA-binding NtrC family response regulator
MTSRVPRILVIDDIYGATRDGRNRDRESFCFRAGIADITGDISSENLKDPIAEGNFCSGQVQVGESIENDLSGTLEFIRRGFDTHPRCALLLLDLHFKTGQIVDGEAEGRDEDRDPRRYFGLQLLLEMRRDEALADLPVVILSSMDRNEVEAVFAGLSALDFCDKNDLDREKTLILIRDNGLIEDGQIIGQSLPILQCLREARRRAVHGNDNILLVGESGTGKELLANYIHRVSGRVGRYVPLFTQGVPDTLIEDRLFGHDKGAFAGADTAAAGAAEQADKGTLFIDEFGDIPLSVQAKLLRLLDTNIRESQRLGATKATKLDLHVVMATSRLDNFSGDKFRADLLHRAKAEDAIELPPLRHRAEDIPVLAEYFLRQFEERLGAEHRTIPPETMEILVRHDWPGNVRDLERVIEHAVLNFKGIRVLSPQHLNLRKSASFEPPSSQDLKLKETLKPTVMKAIASSETEALGLRDLLQMLASFPYNQLPVTDLIRSYGVARDAMARCMAGLLRQALVATSRPTPEKPDGEIYYSPAIHLLLGIQEQEKTKWKTPKCADMVRNIIGISENLTEELLSDPVLRSAYEAATRLRRKK